MNPHFKIQQKGNSCLITGTSYKEYLDENATSQPYREYKYKDTATVYIIQSNKVDSSQNSIETFIVDHCSYLDELHHIFNIDGFYTIYQVIVPTLNCINNKFDNSYYEQFSDIFAYNEDTDTIQQFNGKKWNDVSPEIFTLDYCDPNYFISCQDMFMLANLWTCYVKLCQSLFESSLLKCKKSTSEDLTFRRDVVWMTINILGYYVKRDQLNEAQRLLEEVEGCNGLCKDIESIKQKGCGCGR